MLDHSNNNERSILHSLEFLRREAETNGCEDLSLILQTAISLASSRDTHFEISDDPEAQLVANFLLKFFQSSEAVQRNVIEVIDENKLK